MLLKTCLATFIIILVTANTIKSQDKYHTNWGKWEGPRSSHIPHTYEIDLDLPYEQRMREVMTDFRPAIDRLLSYLWIKHLPLGIFDYIMYPLASYYNQNFADEVQTLANLIENSFTKILLLNLMYDASAACSSVLVLDQEGHVIHGRNLDFGMTSYISDLTFHGKYYKDGSLVYESMDVAGYTGILTAFKPNAYSFSINMYRIEDENLMLRRAEILFSHFTQILKGHLTPPYAIRKAFENSEDYDSLVKALCDIRIASRVFYIVAGAEKYQGIVITKFQDKVHHVEAFDPQNKEKWFIAHSNYVRYVPDPEEDNRRTAASERLEAIGRDNINRENLFSDIMDQYPTFNLYTIYTNIMQTSENYFNTTIWIE